MLNVEALMLYFVVAFGTFMTYIYTPTFDDAEARLVLYRLFFGKAKERKLERLLLLVNVFGGAGVAYLLLEPTTPKLAVSAGLGWTSVASVARTGAVVALRAASQQVAAAGQKEALASGGNPAPAGEAQQAVTPSHQTKEQ